MMENQEVVTAVIGNTQKVEGEAELSKAVTEIEFQAESIVIATEDDYRSAGEFGRLLKKKSAEVSEFFAPMKKAAHDAHKQVCDREKQMLTPLVNAEKIIKKAMSTWATEQERKRKEEEERLRKLAEEETNRLLQQAIEAEASGKSDEASVAIANASVIEQAGRSITIDVAKPKVEGVSTSTDWEIESIDASLVPIAIAGMELRPVDEAAVKRLIKASKGKIEIPGVKYKEVVRMSFKK